jgi:hypothetical protein
MLHGNKGEVMPEFIRLQIIATADGVLLGMYSSSGQVADYPMRPWQLPEHPPTDGVAVLASLPDDVRSVLAQLPFIAAPESLTFWLDVQHEGVRAWPWEALVPRPGDEPFAMRPATPLARAYAAPARQLRQPGDRLQVLLVGAAPSQLPFINPTQFFQQLQAIAATTCDFQVLPASDRTQLQAALLAERYDLMVVYAHGQANRVALVDALGDTEWASAADLHSLLQGLPQVPAVVLACCESASFAVGSLCTGSNCHGRCCRKRNGTAVLSNIADAAGQW